MKTFAFPTAIVLSKQWQLCTTVKPWQLHRTQGVYNQIRRLSSSAAQRLEEKKEARGEQRSEDRLTPLSCSLLSNPFSKRVGFTSQLHDDSCLISSKPADDLVFLERAFSNKIKVKVKTPDPPLVVLLVTPSRLELLDDESAFIPKLLALLFSNPKKSPELDILVAVIDKIPYPRHKLGGTIGEFPNHNGYEGISVLIGESERVAPDLWDARDRVGERETMTTQQPSTLSFLLEPSAAEMTNIAAKTLKWNAFSYELQLPMANTLFQNGQRSTLYAERWKTSESDTGFSRVRKVFLSQQTLHLGSIFPNIHKEFKLDTMLTPIVPPRIIAAAMGNIIRQVSTDPGSDPHTTVPASKELEEAVSQYIEANHNAAPRDFRRSLSGGSSSQATYSSLPDEEAIPVSPSNDQEAMSPYRETIQDPHHQMNIWALVTPEECRESAPWERSGLQKWIENGSRLHRVLSGGGGWGIKEGLLALDPDCDYNCPANEIPMDLGENPISDLAGAPVCRDIFKPGDLVAFFASTSHADPGRSLEKRAESLHSWNVRAWFATVFGTVPSRMDAMPDSDVDSRQARLPFGHVLVWNHFGMLSEQGMSITIRNHGFDTGQNASAETSTVVVQTKLDAPYTCFSAVTLFHPRLSFMKVVDKRDMGETD